MKNEHGLEVDYFVKRLGRVIRDLHLYKKDELARDLYRIACCADSEVSIKSWIDVSERLPKYAALSEQFVFFLSRSCGVVSGVYDYASESFWSEGNRYEDITHWITIPELPEAA